MNKFFPQKSVQDALGDMVEQYTCAITLIQKDDQRIPPGDHLGTGSILEVEGVPHLITCEHVAKRQSNAILGYSLFGAEYGIQVGGDFKLHPYPMDFAIASVEATWEAFEHRAKAIPQTLLAKKHLPVYGEYLYVYGFPGKESHVGFGEHYTQGVGIFTHEIDFQESLEYENPKPLPDMHIVLASNPENAALLSGPEGHLPLTDGMSGSLVWNTRYMEKVEAGEKWSPSDARVTGILWGDSTKGGFLIATPIEHWIDVVRNKR